MLIKIIATIIALCIVCVCFIAFAFSLPGHSSVDTGLRILNIVSGIIAVVTIVGYVFILRKF